jgi:phosphoribosyl 1,2-cyclic phosphodiesterase
MVGGYLNGDGSLRDEPMELHVLASGSDGNCSILRADGVTVMVDAGLSGKRIIRLASHAGIDLKEVSAILLTHEHSDHVKGAGVLSRRFSIPVHANRQTFMASRLGKVDNWVEFNTLDPFTIGGLEVMPLPISHHAAEPNSFSFSFGGRRCLIATDIGKMTPGLQNEIDGSDIVMLESNHDVEMLRNGSYPQFLKTLILGERGHLSNDECAMALARSKQRSRSIFLAHMSKNNNRPELARESVSSIMGCGMEELLCLEEGEPCPVPLP